MKIESKFWPLFVQATFGVKPETLFWYVMACITAVIILPISWIGVLVNFLTMKSRRDEMSKPFPLLLSIFAMPIACATGVCIWDVFFAEPSFAGWWDKLLFAWALGFPGLIAVTVALFVGAIVAAAIVYSVILFKEWAAKRIQFGTRVTYTVDDHSYNLNLSSASSLETSPSRVSPSMATVPLVTPMPRNAFASTRLDRWPTCRCLFMFGLNPSMYWNFPAGSNTSSMSLSMYTFV